MSLNVAAASRTSKVARCGIARSADHIVARIESFAWAALGIVIVGILVLAVLGPAHRDALRMLVALPLAAIVTVAAIAVCVAYVHFAWITPPGIPLSQRSVALQSLVWLGRWAGGAAVIVVSAMAGADLAIPGNNLTAAGQYFTGALILGPPVAMFTMGIRLALASPADKRAAWISQWTRFPAPHSTLTLHRLWLAAMRRWTRSVWTLPTLFFVPYTATLVITLVLIPASG